MQFQCNDTALKITTDFSDNVHFYTHLVFKFTINANIVYIPFEAKFTTSILCPNHHGQYSNGLSLHLLCPDLSDPRSLTGRTSDNQHLGTSNDTTSVAKHRTLKSQLD